MDKERFFSFLIVAILVMIGFSFLQRAILPPPVAKKDGVEDKKDGKAGKGGKSVDPKGKAKKEDGKKKSDGKGKKTDGKGKKTDGKGKKKDGSPQISATPPKPKAKPAIPSAWYTLGSLDPNSKYPFLVVFSNRGGTIDSVYLNDPNYLDLENKSGTFGPMALTNASSPGCVINLVAPGSAAEKAGLQVGDKIVKMGDEQVTSVEDFEERVKRTKPEEGVDLRIERKTTGNTVTSLTINVTLADRPLALISPHDTEEKLRNLPGTGALTLSSIASDGDATALKSSDYAMVGLEGTVDQNWAVKVEDNSIEFHYELTDEDLKQVKQSGSMKLWKRFEFHPLDSDKDKEYSLSMKVGLRNTGKAKQTVSYMLYGPSNLPTEGWWYTVKIHPSKFSSIGARDVIFKTPSGGRKLIGGPQIFSAAQDNPTDPVTKPIMSASALNNIGVDTQYFTAMFIPSADITFQVVELMTLSDVQTLEGKHVRKANSTFRIANVPMTLAPGDSQEHDYRIFLGPKHPKLLARYELGDSVVYGWFQIFAKPLSGLLHLLYSIFGNYGIAIIALTVLVRGAMFPLSRKAARSAQMMQILAPEMKKINEKYKNDLQKRGEALRTLWSKHNYNPYGSCLLMFVQLPVFIGLFRALSVDIELRGAAFIPGIEWCSNLAGPDQFWYWKDVMWKTLSDETGWLGPYFNVLPICTIVLFFIHQKLFTPPPTDDQQKMAQTMMKFMMLFIALLFFKVPSGLCLYFIASSLWGLAERIFLPKPPTVGEGTGTAESSSDNGGTSPDSAHARAKAKKKRRKR